MIPFLASDSAPVDGSTQLACIHSPLAQNHIVQHKGWLRMQPQLLALQQLHRNMIVL